MKPTPNTPMVKMFLTESTTILKEQITFLSQLIRIPIQYPPDEMLYSFFSELYLHALAQHTTPSAVIHQKFIDTLLTINKLPPDKFLIKQFHVLLNIQYYRISSVLDLYFKKHIDLNDKESIKAALQQYLIEG